VDVKQLVIKQEEKGTVGSEGEPWGMGEFTEKENIETGFKEVGILQAVVEDNI